MEMQFPALVHGVEKLVVKSGVMRDVKGTQTATIKLDLPKERRRGATELNVQLTPSLAGVTLDALPYLADYPYGCVEQTMSRFLPSVVVAKTLTDLGVDLEDLKKRADAYAAGIGRGQPGAGRQRLHLPEGHAGQLQRGGAGEPHGPPARTPPDLRPDGAGRHGAGRAGPPLRSAAQGRRLGLVAGRASDPYMTAYVVLRPADRPSGRLERQARRAEARLRVPGSGR